MHIHMLFVGHGFLHLAPICACAVLVATLRNMEQWDTCNKKSIGDIEKSICDIDLASR